MKKTNIPYYPETTLICTDGSTIPVTFPYTKQDFYINPDIKSNPIWLPDLQEVELEGISDKSSKFENYAFDFESLIKDETQK